MPQEVLLIEEEYSFAEKIKAYLPTEGIEMNIQALAIENIPFHLQKSSPDLVLLNINLGTTEEILDLTFYLQNNFNFPFIFYSKDLAKKSLIDSYLLETYRVQKNLTVLKKICLKALLQGLSENHPLLTQKIALRDTIFCKKERLINQGVIK